MALGRHPHRMDRAPRRDDRRTLAGTGDRSEDLSRLRSTANFRQKCSRIPHLEKQESDNLQRFPLGRESLDDNLPNPIAAVSGRVIRTDAASVNFPDSLLVEGLCPARPATPFAPLNGIAGTI